MSDADPLRKHLDNVYDWYGKIVSDVHAHRIQPPPEYPNRSNVLAVAAFYQHLFASQTEQEGE